MVVLSTYLTQLALADAICHVKLYGDPQTQCIKHSICQQLSILLPFAPMEQNVDHACID